MPGANCANLLHSGNIRLPNLKYQQRMMNIAQAGGKNIDVITRDIVIDKG